MATLLVSLVLFCVVATPVAAVSTTDVTGDIILEEGRERTVDTGGAVDVTFEVTPGDTVRVGVEAELPTGNEIIEKVVGKM